MKKNKMMYSVIILTKNEELNIENCISSISNECEVIVLDSGSTDKTELISKNLGAKFFVNRQSGSFIISDQRNWGLKNCQLKNKWVLFLDADEEMNLNLHQTIIEKIKSNIFNAYKLTPKYLFWGKWLKLTQGYPNWHDRLLNKDEVWIEGGVWEHFNKQAKVGYIKIPYKHYANSKGFDDWLERHDRYSSWDAKNINDYLNHKSGIGTERKVFSRKLLANIWPIRPFLRFFHMYIIRLGFMEGWRSLFFCLLYFLYEFMIVVKIIELKRLKAKKQL